MRFVSVQNLRETLVWKDLPSDWTSDQRTQTILHWDQHRVEPIPELVVGVHHEKLRMLDLR